MKGQAHEMEVGLENKAELEVQGAREKQEERVARAELKVTKGEQK